MSDDANDTGKDDIDKDLDALGAQVVTERRRELAIEHLLFGTIGFIQRSNPGLLDELEESLGHLGDSGPAETKDDEAVRDIARRFIKGVRSKG